MKKRILVVLSFLLLCLALAANTGEIDSPDQSAAIYKEELSDYILLKNGDSFSARVLNDRLTLTTSYAVIDIPREYIAAIDLGKEKALVDMRENGHLSGFFMKGELLLRLGQDKELSLRIEDIRKIEFRTVNETPPGSWQTIYIQNGDYFKGKVKNEDLRICTTYGQVPIDLAMIKRIDFYNIVGISAIELLDGVVRGIVKPDEIDIELSFGPTIQVYKNIIAKIENLDKGSTETIQAIGEVECTLTIVAGNELAKEAFILVDGEKVGTLESGSLVITDLELGRHIITVDGERLNKQESEVVFSERLESKAMTVLGTPATRALRIKTEPTGARIWIDERELSSTSPWQEVLEVGKEYHIRVVKENYGKSERKLALVTKGEIIILEIDIPEADAPDKPQLTYPASNSRDIPTGIITLKWESKESDLTYRIEFDGKTYTTKNKSYTVSANERGKTYNWKVTATNEWGKETVSDTYSFTTKVNSAPNITLVSPVNASAGILANSITLKWTGKDSDGDEISYRVYFGETSSPTYITTTKESEYKVSNKDWGKRYYWKVEASDNYGGVTTSQVNSFTTQENRAPNAPSVPSPYNYATNQPTTITLSWECSDPDGDALTYDVYFGIDASSMTKVSINQSGSTLNIGDLRTLSYGTTYYWKVVAKDSEGGTTEGPEWRFTTQSAPTASSYTPSSIFPPTVLVEKGSFTMGDTWGGGDSDEKPTHKVTLTYDFYMGKYEVTFDEYDAFCEATGRSKPRDYYGWGRETRPVINVSWNDAIAYCNWLSGEEKLPKSYDSNGNLLDKDGRVTTDPSKVVGYRLPTEAEWEYAARGGNKSKGYKYSGSDNVDMDNVAWYYSNSGHKTQRAGMGVPNELELYDMGGNVWEWCSDWFGSYSSSAQTNPYNSTAGSYRVARGGSWNDDAVYVRISSRGYYTPTSTISYLGFRIARTVTHEGENRPPLAPYNPSPSEKETNQPTTITLSWECSDPDGDSLTYDVYFGTSSNPTKVSTSQSGRTLNRSNLSYGTTYYWKVVAKDSKGATTEGPVWKFKTQSATPKSMPTARSWLAAVNIGNKIMVIGGGNRLTKTPYARNEIYNPITNSWETRTPMPTPRYALAAAEYNGKVYVFGGQQIFGNASPVNKVEIYDPVTDSWTTGSPMPKAMCELSAATCGDKIYVIAGLNYATRYNTLQIYSPDTDSWTVGAPLPKAFSQHAAVGYGGKVYVFGGMDNSRKRLDTVYIYDPQSNTWSSGTPAPTARSEIAAAVVGSKIYIFGGITKDFTEGLTTVDIYDPLSDSWQKGDPYLSKRSAPAAASVGSKAYLIGGYLYGNTVIELDSIEVYSTE